MQLGLLTSWLLEVILWWGVITSKLCLTKGTSNLFAWRRCLYGLYMYLSLSSQTSLAPDPTADQYEQLSFVLWYCKVFRSNFVILHFRFNVLPGLCLVSAWSSVIEVVVQSLLNLPAPLMVCFVAGFVMACCFLKQQCLFTTSYI